MHFQCLSVRGACLASAAFFAVFSPTLRSEPLADALNHPTLTVTTSGSAGWYAQTAVTHDATAAARSGAITHNQQSVMETTVEGPTIVTFWWWVNSDDNDYLTFYIDDVEQGRISDDVRWQQIRSTLPAGSHTLKWIYAKDAAITSGADCGRVDQLTVSPAIATAPAGTLIDSGDNAVLVVAATGGDLHYQWYGGSTGDTANPAPGATGATLVTPPLASAASFWVRVDNASGTVDSESAAVAVSPLPHRCLKGMGENWTGQLGVGPELYDHIWPVEVGYRVTQVSSRFNHALFVTADGALFSMGFNAQGQLGDGSTSSRDLPVAVATDVAQVAAGRSHSLFLKTDGSLWGMGAGYMGQLGNTAPTYNLLAIPITTGATQIAAGEYFTLYVTNDGSLWGMGANSFGQLGSGPTAPQFNPVWIATGIAQIAAGNDHSLFLKTDGTLWAMGRNQFGQLGDGTAVDRNVPIQIADDVISVSAGHYHSLYVTTDGTLWSTGYNSWGQLGDNSTDNRSSPVAVASGVRRASGGSAQSLFIKDDRSLWGMGYNEHGALGDGSAVNRLTPVQVANNVTHCAAAAGCSFFLELMTEPPTVTGQPIGVDIASGSNAVLAVTATGPDLSYQWYAGSAGDTTQPIAGATGPMLVTPPLSTGSSFWVRISNPVESVDSAAAVVTIAPLPYSDLLAMGTNEWGQLGDGSATDQFTPVPIATGVIHAAGGGSHSLYFKADGTTWAMGSGEVGQFGTGDQDGSDRPKQIATVYSRGAAGFDQSFFVTADGALWATGYNLHGQLGDGSTTMRYTPALIAEDVSMVVGSVYHSMFLTQNGTLWGMGANGSGQLGPGLPIIYESPLQITTGIADVAVGESHTLYVTTDGTLWGVGRNEEGQLGDGSSTNRYTPVRIATGVVKVAVRNNHSLFIKFDGSLWAMGDNSHGQLGDGSTLNRDRPVEIAADVTQVAAGEYHSLFVTADGTLRAMGGNEYGQLGDGFGEDQILPVIIASGVRKIAAGWRHSLFLQTPAQPGPDIITQPVGQFVHSGTPTSFTVAVSGPGPFTFQWRHNQVDLPDTNVDTLTLEDPQPEDAGVYDVIVTNPFATVVSNTAELIVHDEAFVDFAAWTAGHGVAGGPLDDPEGCGVPNLLRYAFKLSATGPVSALTTVQTVTGEDGQEYLAIAFTRKSYAADILYIVEASSDLVHWDFVTNFTAGYPEDIVVQDGQPLGEISKRFMRVRVEIEP